MYCKEMKVSPQANGDISAKTKICHLSRWVYPKTSYYTACFKDGIPHLLRSTLFFTSFFLRILGLAYA